MLLRRLTVQNYRSFLHETIFETEGLVSIIIGPNGGGKTNLLDAVVIMLRRYIFASRAPVHIPQPTNPDLWEFRSNDSLNNMHLEKYAGHEEHPQFIELEATALRLRG